MTIDDDDVININWQYFVYGDYVVLVEEKLNFVPEILVVGYITWSECVFKCQEYFEL